MHIRLQSDRQAGRADVFVIGVWQGSTPQINRKHLPAPVRRLIVAGAKAKDFGGGWQKIKAIHYPFKGYKGLLLVGLGRRTDWNLRRLRLAGRTVIRQSHQHGWKSATIQVEPWSVNIEPGLAIGQLSENLMMANYNFTQFRKAPKSGWPEVQSVTLQVPTISAELRKAVSQAMVVAEAVNTCRDLSNFPGGNMTPKLLAKEARKVTQGTTIKTKVLSRKDMERLKMGAILGVARGSDEEPKLIVMEYYGGKKRQAPLGIAGKGVTFDSGGLNLKPDPHMNEMHMDMAGGAAAISGIVAIAKLKLLINVVAIIPAVENMPSGSGYRPGDLLHSMSGKVIEVVNTDAEGRVILADALTYLQKEYKPKEIVDLATLTGSALAALGQQAIAFFTNKSDFEGIGRSLGEDSGDYVWPLPLWEEYDFDVRGTFGDVANSGKSRYGGAINGAKFLEQFVDPKLQWTHLDIAPTMTAAEGDALAKGATGTGVRWIVALAKRFSNDTA